MDDYDPSHLSDYDLLDVARHIDGERFPERLQLVQAEIERRRAGGLLPSAEETDRLEGLGGWLAVVGISLVASVVSFAVSLAEGVTALRGPLGSGSDVVEVVIWVALDLSFLAFVLAVLWLFLARAHRFPEVFIALQLAGLLLGAVGQFSANAEPMAAYPHLTPVRDFWSAIARCAVWIPYMYMSERVENTFRAPGEAEDTATC